MFEQLFENLKFILSQIRFQDFVDIMLVWAVVYRILILVRRTGTVQMLSGLGILAIGFILSIWFDFFTFKWLLEKFFSNLFVIVVILFQGEIRRALAQIGSNPLFTDYSSIQEAQDLEEIAKAAILLAQRGYGALIVLEGEIISDYHVEHGVEIDAKIASEAMVALFHPSSPVHDGALIIRNGRIFTVGSFLPLSKNPILDKNLGTRHRAAIGLTEETDSLVLVVSEENKSVGVTLAGQLKMNLQLPEIRQMIYEFYGLKYKGPS